MRVSILSLVVVAGLTSGVNATPVLTAMTSFGGGDGWRAPGEVVSGDISGTATAGVYNYLGTGRLERGLAVNPTNGNLILVSRSTAGNGIRVLNGATGADSGFLNQGTGIITGGTFSTNMVGVADDGSIYVNNLVTNVSSAAYKVYKWSGESASAPTTFFNSTVAGFTIGAPRVGDSFDVIGSGANLNLVQGTSGVIGYVRIDGAGAATATNAFSPTGPTAGDFRLGITFASSSTDIWGKQTGASAAVAPLRRSTFGSPTATYSGASTLSFGGEMAMDYNVIDGVPYLAVLTANTQATADTTFISVYNMASPSSPLLVAQAENTTGALITNPDATGSIKWGVTNGLFTPIYAMSTNQGIQAFNFSPVPEASSFLAVGAVGMLFAAVRRFRRR